MPRSSAVLEALLAEVRIILEDSQIGASDDFFEVGGDSMTAVELVVRLEESHGIAARIPQVLQAQSFFEMAEMIESDAHPGKAGGK